MSEKKFSGGDAFPRDSLEYRTYLIMMKSELRDGAGAYEMSNAVSGRSGPSFGPFQYDIGSNQNGRNLLESITETAIDVQSRRILSNEELEDIKGHFYKPFGEFTAADSALYDRLEPKLNAALSSDAGIKAINADFVPGVQQKVAAVNAVVDGMTETPNKTFMSGNDAAKLILIDTRNQYGDAVNDGLKKFISLTSTDTAMDMPGRRHGATIKVEGAFGLDDLVRYKLQTQYAQSDRGTKDVLRRISHCVEAAGIENVKASLSEEDREFFKTGLEKYLTDQGRDAAVLDSVELKALAELGGREPLLKVGSSGPAVADVQRKLAALGYQHRGRPIEDDGDFGPTTRGAIEDFQRQHHLDPDGKVGGETAGALEQALQQSAITPITLSHPQHPGFSLFQQAFNGVGQLDQTRSRPTDVLSCNLSGALALSAQKEGLERIDRVILSEDSSRAFAVQESAGSLLRKFAFVDVIGGINTPLAQSSADWSRMQMPEAQNAQEPAPLLQSADVRLAQPPMQR
ncbi:hypothetical protein ASD68_05435 [Rhodanobacter sp. Root627]|uniref:peptidoglycan-binding domain-containing protein n=1 Tax=Rhodanobacter sp. Root627 TaxID=1736572 RepID=UPI00070103FE|nr:peptidoglycan-binding domain-containing protein [Rhodanobacter sp. Root627]KRA35822.1 hypothetical protein ASD68_05435 [Rhodanobacter sp. Root627]